MKTLEQFKADQEKELLEFQSEQTLRAELPEDIRDKGTVCIHRDHASFMLHEYQSDKQYTLAKALNLVRQFQDKIVESEHWKDGCISIRPAEINETSKRERAVMDGSHLVEIKVDGGKGYGPNCDLRFWIKLDWGLVEICVYVSGLWKLVPNVKNRYYKGEIVSSDVIWPIESQCVDKFRKWWSSPGSYAGSYYLADLPNFESWASNMIAPGLSKESEVA